MITGFNHGLVCGGPHSQGAQTFPGAFTGIGEFTINKEFVSAKIPAKSQAFRTGSRSHFRFRREVGLVVLIHNDIDVPLQGGVRTCLPQSDKGLFKRHRM